MIIKYEFGNFKSFKDNACLSLKASSQTTYNQNLIRKNKLRILPSSVIYGANASGKSNIVKSLSIFRSIVLTGNLSSSSLNELSVCPFIHCVKIEPIHFDIEFISDNTIFNYVLDIYVKSFTSERHIIFESLSIVKNSKKIMLFKRDKKGVVISTDNQALLLMEEDKNFISGINDKLNKNLDENFLFLTNGFKSIISGKTADKVINFFDNELFVIKNFTASTTILQMEKSSPNENIKVWNELLNIFVHAADFGPQKIYYTNRNNDGDASDKLRLISEYNMFNSNNMKVTIPAPLIESNGTIKLIDFAVIFQDIFSKGGTLVIDEFDASIHPEIVKGVISIFNNSQINKKGAQFIFTTHNPIYLNNKIFRRDQILFVDKDKNDYKSSLYTLADFGSESVRNDENFLINYFKGKYSAMPFIDFSVLLGNADGINKGKEV